jgi:hypothetical protein
MKKVTIDMADILIILIDFNYSHLETRTTMYRFEHLVEEVVRPKVKSSISLEDFTLYVGAISSLLWSNRIEYYNNTPLALTVQQHENGCFSSRVESIG